MRRIECPNHARFLTFSCYQRMDLLGSPAVRDEFERSLSQARDRLGFRLHAWVAMPNHVHLIIRPGSPDQTLPQILQAIKQSPARRVLARWRELDAPILDRLSDSRGLMRFWQRGGGYDRNLYSADVITEKVEYIHGNPVRAGLV